MRHLDALGEIPEHLLGVYDIVQLRLFQVVVRDNDPGPLLRNVLKMLSGCFVPLVPLFHRHALRSVHLLIHTIILSPLLLLKSFAMAHGHHLTPISTPQNRVATYNGPNTTCRHKPPSKRPRLLAPPPSTPSRHSCKDSRGKTAELECKSK